MCISDSAPTFRDQSFPSLCGEHPVSHCDVSGANEQIIYAHMSKQSKNPQENEQLSKPSINIFKLKKKYKLLIILVIGSNNNERQKQELEIIQLQRFFSSCSKSVSNMCYGGKQNKTDG